jgi:hypothetical protein
MTAHEFTSEQIQQSIAECIKSGNHDMLVKLMEVLAAWYPEDASAILDAIDFRSALNA